jgi:hypothetical protein
MIIARALVTPFVIAGITLCCCCMGPWAETVPVYVERTPVDIVGGYSLGRPMLSGLELYRPSDPDLGESGAYHVLVHEAVARIGWDDEFILVERHPQGTTFDDKPVSPHPEWYVVVVSTGEVRTSYSYDRFLDLRAELGVPDSIEMRDARKVYYGGWIPRYRQSD